MDIKHLLFGFDGRIRRTHFWLATIGITIVSWILLGILFGMSGMGAYMAHQDVTTAPATSGMTLVSGLLILVVFFFVIWADLAIQVKRWHDRDKSWFWIFLAFVPIVGGLWILIECGFLDGTQGPNRFGPSPKAVA